MIQSRPYQSRLINETNRALAKHQRVVVQSPTGSGKSHIMNSIVNMALAKGRTILVVSESTKIYDQLVKGCGGIEINSNVKHRVIEIGKCYVAMAQTLSRRKLIIKQFKDLGNKLIILNDEAHIGTATKLLKNFEDAYIAGFTATPAFKWAKFLPELYNEIVVGPQVDDLIQDGYLCSYKHIARTKDGLNDLIIKNGEYTESSQEKVFGTSVMYDGLIEDLRSTPYKKCVVFTASIKHCNSTAKMLLANGFKACQYHSQIPNASYELAKFTELNLCDIVVSVAALTKGWDYPPIDLVVLLRKTSSLPLFLQMCGRASRIVPGKSGFTVLDYGENYKDHLLYFSDRDWQKLWNTDTKRKKKSQGVAPVALCPSCDAIYPATTRKCPYCGAIRPATEKELEQGKLVEITSHYSQMVGRKISTLNPQELSLYAKIKNKQRFAARIAKSQEQGSPGFLQEFAHHMGYKQGWVNIQMAQIKGANRIDFADITLR